MPRDNPTKKKAAVSDDFKKMIDALDLNPVQGLRDLALHLAGDGERLLLGAMRNRLGFADAGISKDAIFTRIRKSSQVTAERLTGEAARIGKGYAEKDELMASQYAGHSLRSGFLTSAGEVHASLFKMQAQSRHKSLDVLAGYVQHADLFEDHAGDGLLGTPALWERKLSPRLRYCRGPGGFRALNAKFRCLPVTYGCSQCWTSESIR